MKVKHCDRSCFGTFRTSRKLSCVLTAKTFDESWRIIEREPTRNFRDKKVQRSTVLSEAKRNKVDVLKLVENAREL